MDNDVCSWFNVVLLQSYPYKDGILIRYKTAIMSIDVEYIFILLFKYIEYYFEF